MTRNVGNVDRIVCFISDKRMRMEQAIAALPPAMRAVFTLRDVEEFSVAETATILGLSEAAVKTALHRARLLLRESLASYFQERCQPKRSTRDHKGEGAQ